MSDVDKIPAEHLRRAALLATVGSTAHGISVSQEGTEGDDLDLMGVYVPPREQVYGLHEGKTIVWRSKPEGVRSEAGDIDLTLHPLRKFLSLAYKGNPTILGVMFSPEQWTFGKAVTREERGHIRDAGGILIANAPMFCSKRAGYAFRGYAEAQYQRLMGERGQMKVHRPELIDAYGYDVKYAAHTLRLTMQGATMLRDGYMPMPLQGEQREFILSVRRGEVTFDDCALRIQVERANLDAAIEQTALPEYPSREHVDQLIVQLHDEAWG